ncbi:MAG: c-type cytochrome [Chloroflexi bacterium]|nr:c-type cytochrome [Chloroflexota bacterium]
MNEEQKKKYYDKYLQAKQKGVKFWPDIIYKDLIVSFALFLLLIGLAAFIGVAQEPKADPNDANYVPRPEWYFLFLFEFLKFIPGKLEWVGTTLIPGIGILILLLLPFIDKNPYRNWKKRKVGITMMGLVVLGIIGLTVRSVITTPEVEEVALAGSIAEQVIQGQDLYSIYCTECHQAEGEGGEIVGVEGLEGVIVKSISSVDEMWTRTDETFFNIIDFGQQDLGMPPNGLGYGGELQRSEIEKIVTFMRYTWDERAEIPEDAIVGIPSLAEGEVPSYEVHISAVAKRYCVSCHRPGKENNEYLMQSYEEILTTGDNAENNIIAGDLGSYLIVTLHRESIFDASGEEIIGPMPPSKDIKAEYIDMFERWALAGMPETADEAAALSEPAVEEAGDAAPAIPEAEATPVP